MLRYAQRRGIVVQHPRHPAHQLAGHESLLRAAVARKLAGLLQYQWAERYWPGSGLDKHVYFVPDYTLTGPQAHELGIRDQHDLFGGVVPHAYMADKTVTHPLCGPQALAPRGWSAKRASCLGLLGLRGYSAFAPADARAAALRLLAEGPVRFKLADARGGTGQLRIDRAADIDPALADLGEAGMRRQGVVVEQHLDQGTTFSVGQLHVADLDVAYCGTQRLTRDNAGHEVYGGSTLLVVRGTLQDLLCRKLPHEMAQAVRRAQLFDNAFTAWVPGFVASRRNYDVMHGRDASGAWHTGVVDQSWRVGGASPAEMAALEALRADPSRDDVRASCTEAYGSHAAPRGAEIYFQGVDEKVGPMIKYSEVERHASFA